MLITQDAWCMNSVKTLPVTHAHAMHVFVR